MRIFCVVALFWTVAALPGAVVAALPPRPASAPSPIVSPLVRVSLTRFRGAHQLTLSSLPGARGGAPPPHPVSAPSSLVSPLVRVSLTRFRGAHQLTLSSLPGARLLRSPSDGIPDAEVAAGSGPWTATAATTSIRITDRAGNLLGDAPAWRLQPDDTEVITTLVTPGKASRRFRGSLILTSNGGKLSVVNELDMENYLRGVVPCEIGPAAPTEALKAQAVAARTYAMQSAGRWAAEGADVRDSTDSQVYGGVNSESPASDRAIEQTAGLVLMRGGAPIYAAFCADCGGITAPGESANDYPPSVHDEDAHPTPVNWQIQLTPEALAAALAADPSLRAEGSIVDAAVLDTDESGRVRRLSVTYAHPAQPLPSPPLNDPLNIGIEPAPAPPDQTTRVLVAGNTLRRMVGVTRLKSTLFTIARAPQGGFVLSGRGYGHGRGMCQVGAMALATTGRDFRFILNRYYPGADIAPIPDSQQGGGIDTSAAPSRMLQPVVTRQAPGR